MKHLFKFESFKTTIREFLNEKNITKDDVYYHGSPNYFSTKDIKPNNKGLIFFSKDRNIAFRYATNDFHGNTLGDEYNIIKAHLDVKNTFDPEEHDNNAEIIELLGNTGNFENVGRFPDYYTLASKALYNGEWSVLETKEFIDGLKEMGYDSILIDNRPYYVPNYKGEQTFNKDIAVFYNNVIKPIERLLKESDEEHRKALSDTGFWGKQGAGCIILCRSTKRFLLPLRSSYILEPNTWGVWGGAIDSDEDPQIAAERELTEEAGYSGRVEMVPLSIFQKDSFRYYNFLAIVDEEFTPQLNWETKKFTWTELDNFPEPLHFGLKWLLSQDYDKLSDIILSI